MLLWSRVYCAVLMGPVALDELLCVPVVRYTVLPTEN